MKEIFVVENGRLICKVISETVVENEQPTTEEVVEGEE